MFSVALTNVCVTAFQAEAEIQNDAVAPGQKVLVIDDLLATGGETRAEVSHQEATAVELQRLPV